MRRLPRARRGSAGRLALALIALALGAGIGRSQTERPSGRSHITPILQPAAEDPARVALGRELYGSTLLSRDGTRSCQSCHDIGTNGASAVPRDTGVGGALLARNTITVFNAALNFRLEWDGKVATLEEQADLALTRPDFMGETWPGILRKLAADPGWASRFQVAYGRPLDRAAVLDALATYQRTLLTPDSRFDRWLRGEGAVLTGQEVDGYRLFVDIGCASCHQGANVGGNLFQKAGIFGPLLGDHVELLRVPSLRNVAVTPPYFDDGSVPTLPEAIQKMATVQLGRSLSSDQVDGIAAFLRTLTGSYDGRPLTAPK